MKTMRIMLLFLVMAGATSTVKAQEVFNAVLQKAESIVNDPNASEMDLKINQYKVTALRYIPSAGIRLYGETTTNVMDVQAYYMSVFLTDYFAAVQKTAGATESQKKDAIMKFVKATRHNPLYDDDDIENTEAFVKDPGGFTPFSLNVNWEKAVKEEQGAE